MVSHVCKLVEFQLVRLILLVELMDKIHILLEHIKALVLLIQTPRHSVMAPPPLIQIPQTFFSLQLFLMEIKTLNNPNNQNQ